MRLHVQAVWIIEKPLPPSFGGSSGGVSASPRVHRAKSLLVEMASACCPRALSDGWRWRRLCLLNMITVCVFTKDQTSFFDGLVRSSGATGRLRGSWQADFLWFHPKQVRLVELLNSED
jgi:hypothetical protein